MWYFITLSDICTFCIFFMIREFIPTDRKVGKYYNVETEDSLPRRDTSPGPLWRHQWDLLWGQHLPSPLFPFLPLLPSSPLPSDKQARGQLAGTSSSGQQETTINEKPWPDSGQNKNASITP